MRRALIIGFATLAAPLAPAAPAMAEKAVGQGLYGPTDDLVITHFGYGLVVFFTVVVFLLSGLQYLLERRKQGK